MGESIYGASSATSSGVRRAISAAAVMVALGISTEAAAKQFADFTPDGSPNLQSRAALIVDLDSGEPLFEKNVDEVRAIASTSKLFVALVVRERGIDLDAVTTISKEDARLARGGARTRLTVGHGFRNVDLLRAMLIASDNRAPSALARAVGLTPSGLIYEMNRLAGRLGLKQTRFTSCSGLNGNVSTAANMAVVLERALQDPVLAEIMTTRSIDVVSQAARPRRIHYRNTNRVLHRDSYEVLGGKTGYTDEAGYCLVTAARHGGKRIGMVLLGSHGKLTRYGDFSRAYKWLEQRAAGSAGVGSVAASAPH